ncbi:glycosyltransferase [Sunxiuqinia sp. A32]|uniref:glycosyltransferase n=1 Tax=Sunxiuqinia sp. A32 TaxID=3461496 RepID=UPI0040465AB7
MRKKLHIISFNIPYPPNYGGIIDVYYKIKALAREEIDVILHCFEYGREKSSELEEFCYKVHYYPRKKGIFYLLSKKPYIVVTRKNKMLLQNLQDEIAPILFEGLHSCFFIDNPLIAAYQKIVRTHNIEHHYYRYLAKSEKNSFKKFYFEQEAMKLQCFEKRLKLADNIISISSEDTRYFNGKYKKTTHIPAFHPFDKVDSKTGKGEYVLFHGNLSVSENQKAVKYLIDKIFTEITIPFTIAGKNPPEWLVKKAMVSPHISVIADPNDEVMTELIREAQLNLIPTFQPTGFKLKLLASLFSGRHCISNSPMVEHTGLESLCNIANNAEDMIRMILEKFEEEFTIEDIVRRKHILENQFSNQRNAKKIIDLI